MSNILKLICYLAAVWPGSFKVYRTGLFETFHEFLGTVVEAQGTGKEETDAIEEDDFTRHCRLFA